jgi:hypothetical protein
MQDLIAVEHNHIELVFIQQQEQILSVHENMNGLIEQVKTMQIRTEEEAKRAIELKREIKATHIAIKTKRDELKEPIIKLNKRITEYADTLYNPLKQAELDLKAKIEYFEKNKSAILTENKEESFDSGDPLEEKLKDLNKYFALVNEATDMNQMLQINTEVSSVNLMDYGNRAAEAGFIISQIKTNILIKFAQLSTGEPVKAPEIIQPLRNPKEAVITPSEPSPADLKEADGEFDINALNEEQKEITETVLKKTDKSDSTNTSIQEAVSLVNEVFKEDEDHLKNIPIPEPVSEHNNVEGISTEIISNTELSEQEVFFKSSVLPMMVCKENGEIDHTVVVTSLQIPASKHLYEKIIISVLTEKGERIDAEYVLNQVL